MTVTKDCQIDQTGHQIGNYRLLRLLQRGESAEIYLGEEKNHHAQVAIKLQDEQQIGNDLAKFFVHTSLLSRLRHPHIVQILDFGMDGNKGYLVMNYAPNGTLRQLHPRGCIVPPETVLQYVKQIASALHYIHQHRVIHCDIKPHNLLLDTNNEVMIGDFGIAIVDESFNQSAVERHDFEGTVIYAAPEQLEGKPQRSSDQYALGVVAYEWLCGDQPFSGTFHEIAHQHLSVSPPPLREKNRALTPAIEQVVMKALAKKVTARFSDVEAFAAALEWAVEQSRDPLIPEPSPRPKRQFLSPHPFQDP